MDSSEKSTHARFFMRARLCICVKSSNFAAGNVSLFVNPDLNSAEPAALCTALPDEENSTKWPLRAISLRNRNAYTGAIGGIRLTQSWDALQK